MMRKILYFLAAASLMLLMHEAFAARAALTVQTPLVKYPASIAANAADITFAAANVTSNNDYTMTGREIVIVRNDDAAAQVITFASIVDELNRTGDITSYSIGASEYAAFGPFPVRGWRQTDGKMYINPGDADLKIAIIQIPELP